MKDLFPELPRLEDDRIVLQPLSPEDASALDRMRQDPLVARYLPTFLYENRYPDICRVMDGLYTDCLEEGSLILGVYEKPDLAFRGLAELYGLRKDLHKISVGCRLAQDGWGRGLALRAVTLLTDHVTEQKQIEIVTSSTLVQNKASARVLEKAGFTLVVSGADEDWGYPGPLPTNKWIR
nr:GNAT family N-acetyltransferase [Lachnospiraceae bacterium]